MDIFRLFWAHGAIIPESYNICRDMIWRYVRLRSETLTEVFASMKRIRIEKIEEEDEDEDEDNDTDASEDELGANSADFMSDSPVASAIALMSVVALGATCPMFFSKRPKEDKVIRALQEMGIL